MIIYRVEVDYGIDNQWTEGHYTTLEKAVNQANINFDNEVDEYLKNSMLGVLYKKEADVGSDETTKLAYTLNAVDNNLNWHFGVYVYRIEVEE